MAHRRSSAAAGKLNTEWVRLGWPAEHLGTVPGLPHPNPHGRQTEAHMEFGPSEEERVARARYIINLQRAFGDLLLKLKRAYGEPAGDATELRSQHVFALVAIANFL